MIFAWDDLNREHIAEHGVSPGEAEEVVRGARPPFPRGIGDEKYMIWGQTRSGRYLQVIIVYKSPDDVSFESLSLTDWTNVAEGIAGKVVRVIHAMDLTEGMKRALRKQN